VEKAGYLAAAGIRPVRVERNQSRTGIEIKLNRAAAVTGRVTGPDDLPAAGAEVVAYRFIWVDGRRTVSRAGSATADDRGVYRIFDLESGRYVIGASMPPDDRPQGELDASSTRAFYPKGAKPAEAAPLEVRWGQEITDVNLAFHAQPAFWVSGVVADAETGGPCHVCVVSAASVDEPYGFQNRQFAVAPDGSYRIRGLTPGSYRVTAIKPEAGRHILSSRIVTLADENIRDVYLMVGISHTITGRVVLDSPPEGLEKTGMSVIFFLPGGRSRPLIARVGEGLSFQAPGLSSETYRVSLLSPPPGGYLKSVRLAGRDLPAPEIDVPEQGDLSQLELVVGFDGATLSGQVKLPDESGSQGHHVTAAVIALFPEENQSPFVVRLRASAAAAGGFTITAIPPGSYTVFAFSPPWRNEWDDPDVRRSFQNYGKTLDLGAGKKETVELVLAPVSSEPR
ncbi:MAG TPA: carboxypeptidase-like regulatory domain-containing protein, partial [Bryobacterales bacterium]|nr:carboxypeptidase-like regulatory domain-containing protein [Bryobacterales bacterium]